jgi:hypothetical protein
LEETRACNEQPCPECVTNAECDDGLYCNGVETCQDGACLAGTAPCDAAHCVEATDACLDCVTNAECNDGDACTLDTCAAGVCSNVFQDTDGDGVCDAEDNAPDAPNPDQLDADSDGIADVLDNCPAVANADQADADGDGIGDLCEDAPQPACIPFLFQSLCGLPLCGPCGFFGLLGTLVGIAGMKRWRRLSR